MIKKRCKQKLAVCVCVLCAVSLFLSWYQPVLAQIPGLTERVSDYDTSDTFSGALINDDGTRKAGRVWSDKSVFGEGESRAQITLDTGTDGYSGSAGTDEDFLHVYSALGSSQHVTELPRRPIDLSLVIDISGSMGADVRYNYGYYYPSPIPHEERKANMRMTKTLAAVNTAINELMDDNPENRVAVTLYGGTANTIMPLDHYERKNNEDILKITNCFSFYFGGDRTGNEQFGSSAGWLQNIDAAFTITADCKKAGSDYKKAVSNYRAPYEGGLIQGDEAGTVYIGYTTNLQAGVWLGFNELANSQTATYTTTNSLDQPVQVSRIPVTFVMSDGGANVTFRESGASKIPDNQGDEWSRLTVPESIWGDSNGVKGSQGFNWGAGVPNEWSAELLYGNDKKFYSAPGTILEVLMTTSYLKNKVEKNYAGLIEKAREMPGGGNLEEAPVLDVRTIGVDLEHVDAWQIPRLYATLNPTNYFKDSAPEGGRVAKGSTEESVIKTAYEAFQEFVSNGSTTVAMGLSDGNNDGGGTDDANHVVKGKLNGLGSGKTETVPGGEITITNQEVIENINYTTSDKFYDVSAAGEGLDIFGQLVREINGAAFNPVSGENDLNGMDMVSYRDPIGEYMEIKDNAVTVDGTVSDYKGTSTQKTYDMSLLLFGQMHGVIEDCVYDDGDKENHLSSGYYKKNLDGGWDYQQEYPENARENGWHFYLSESDFYSRFPRYNTDEERARIRGGTVRIYRCAENPGDVSKYVYFNPAVDESVEIPRIETSDDSEALQKLKEEDGTFTLDEFDIYTEETGGKTTLNFNVPKNALPLEVADITINENQEVLSYKDNTENEKASSPIRLFYSVGMKDELLEDNPPARSGVKTELISDEYKQKHRSGEDLYFYSNLYSENRYTGYESDSEDYRTIGDAFTTFSPGEDNRFYIYQKPLFLSAHAYTVDGDYSLTPVDAEKGHEWAPDKSGNSKTTWPRSTDGTPEGYTDGNYLGLYDSEAAFTLAAQGQDGGYITDSTGTRYKYDPDGIVLLKTDRLTNIDLESPGVPKSGSFAFNADDYYFIIIDYYKAGEGTGVDYSGTELPGTKDGETMHRVIARKGSSFGSGYESEQINFATMLSWHGFSNDGVYADVNFRFVPILSSGDTLRGRPTIERLTQTGSTLQDTLKAQGVKEEMAAGYAAYWEEKQQELKKTFGVGQITPEILSGLDVTLSTRIGGVRVGDMGNEVREKGENQEEPVSLGNRTGTAYNYYVPTVSPNSSITEKSTDLRINSYLGNNGRLKIFEVPEPAEVPLNVNKTFLHDVEAPDEEFVFTLTEDEGNQKEMYTLPEERTAKVTGQGKVSFSPIVFKKEGEYIFWIEETGGGRAGIAYDEGRIKVTVKIKKENGKLSVEDVNYTRQSE